MKTLPRLKGRNYDPGDYLLIDKDGQVQAVSGNSDFWDDPENPPNAAPDLHPRSAGLPRAITCCIPRVR